MLRNENFVLQEEIDDLKQGSVIIKHMNLGLENQEDKLEKMEENFNNLVQVKDSTNKNLRKKNFTLENKIYDLEGLLEKNKKLVIIHSKNIEVNNRKFATEKNKLLSK